MVVQYLNTTGATIDRFSLRMKCPQPTFIFRAERLVQKLAFRREENGEEEQEEDEDGEAGREEAKTMIKKKTRRARTKRAALKRMGTP
ncbi:hypothetical protein G5I_05512 [Acromyrmex echinatior]|uniref:Uncharacterized protein n=1 Tax=Acromyrmex echinatior TaxID=103372 RepID=F4WII8_ACREC|nr:hypothetical protein G5I_05512 [Acromyrmex echinatior]